MGQSCFPGFSGLQFRPPRKQRFCHQRATLLFQQGNRRPHFLPAEAFSTGFTGGGIGRDGFAFLLEKPGLIETLCFRYIKQN